MRLQRRHRVRNQSSHRNDNRISRSNMQPNVQSNAVNQLQNKVNHLIRSQVKNGLLQRNANGTGRIGVDLNNNLQTRLQAIETKGEANETSLKLVTNLLMTADDNFTELNATNDHNDKRINTLDRSFLQIHQGNKEWKNISKKNNSKVIAHGEAIETLQYDNGQLQSEMKTLKATVDKNATNQQTTDDDFEFRIASLEDAKKDETDHKNTEISDELVEAVAAKITA